MLIANILTMLRGKNTRNSGKCLLALPLQHCNLQFFDIFEMECHLKGCKGIGLQACYNPRILVQNRRSCLQQWFAAGGANFQKWKCYFKQNLVVFN